MAEKAASEAGRALAARRRIVERTCAVCGKPITGTSRRLYCSERCKKIAQRQRAKEARAAQAQQPASESQSG